VTLSWTLTTTVTFALCIFILLLFLIALYKRRDASKNGRPPDDLTAIAPGSLISLGIFGTFLGIYLGLREFDSSNIDESIPLLLEGLKTAFVTSLFGMFFSLILKFLFGYFDKRDATGPQAVSGDPVSLLAKTASGVEALNDTVKSTCEVIVRCFHSDEEYSLLSQLKLIRTDMADLRREVNQSLDDFGKKVAELGTEAIIKSLKTVIEQFNAKLSDLVGAEFKQLKEAMVKLVEWQELHRRSVDKMQEQLNLYLTQVDKAVSTLGRASVSLETSSNHLDSIDGSLTALTVSATELEEHSKTLGEHNEQLSALLEQIRSLGNEAKTVLPDVTSHVTELTTNLSASLETSAASMSSHVTELTTNLSASLEKTTASMSDAVGEINTAMQKSSDTHSSQVKSSLDEITKGLETTLTTSLRSLGTELASLSKKFVDDYSPLTDKLKEIVRLSERVTTNDK